MQRAGLLGFGPVFSPHSTALILGTYPSSASFDDGFYYGHPRNRFWPLLASLTHDAVPLTRAEKTQLILDNNLALWDILATCSIQASSDSSIREPVPNNIPALVEKTKIRTVFCNGAASFRYCQKYFAHTLPIPFVRLPSTSPANAAFSFDTLCKEWAPLKAHIHPAALSGG